MVPYKQAILTINTEKNEKYLFAFLWPLLNVYSKSKPRGLPQHSQMKEWRGHLTHKVKAIGIHCIHMENVCQRVGSVSLVTKAIFQPVLSWPINRARSWKTKQCRRRKSFNREVSAIRVHVEHAIGGLKRSNIISDIYRNRREDFDDKVMLTAARWHNLRMSMWAAGK